MHGKVDADTARGILKLRHRIKVPSPILDEKINIATWNIREFGRRKRKTASIHYIAEILSYFDLIAITELRENTKDLERVMKILGPYWKVIYSDTAMDRAGNKERIGYLFDKRVITFTGLAAEADPIRKKQGENYVPTMDWWRSPYMISFKAGKFDFVLLTAHIRWDKERNRIKALENLAVWIDKRRKSKNVKDKDIIVMGDFNIPKVGDRLYKAITSKGLKAPKQLLATHGTNLAKNKRYDQIFYYPEQAQKVLDGGAVDFYNGDIESLYPPSKYGSLSKAAYTFEMSDHLPIWIQLSVWNDDKELKKIIDQSS